MESLKDLFNFILKNERTIVYGNLGRKYHIIYDYLLKELPTFEVIMESDYYKLFSKDHIHVNVRTTTKCDLYIYIEPDEKTLLMQPELAARVVVFTSHLLSKFLTHTYWARASYFHLNGTIENEIARTNQLTNLQQTSRYFDKLDKVFKYRLDFDNVKSVSVNTGMNASINDVILIPGNTYPIFDKKTVVIADLTQSTSAGSMYLYLLDIFDFLRENAPMIHYWFICFPNHHRDAFEYSLENNLNKLFCIHFKYSNLNNADILSIYPFFKAGTINRSKACEKKTLCHLKYVAPQSDFDAYSIATLLNLTALTYNIYLVPET